MRALYGNAANFLRLFPPELQSRVGGQWERAYTGTAPTLQCVSEGYNPQTAITWLCIQLESINNFSGAKEKLNLERQQELAALVISQYSYLKVSELLLFFHRLKCGNYGRFYGSVDPQLISASLLHFMQERRKELGSIQQQQQKHEQQQRKEKPESSNYITCEEYLRRKFEKDPKAESILNNILNKK